MSEALAPNDLPAGPTDVFDAQPPLSPMARVTNIFFAPTKTFADIRRNRSWWLPLVLLAVFGYLFTFSALNKVGATRLAETSIRNSPSQNEKLQQATPEGRAQTIRITATVTQIIFYLGPLLLLLFAAISAMLLWVGFNFILGGSATYSGMFAVTMFAWLPSIIRSLLSLVVVFVGDPDTFNINDPIGTNPGFYMGADSSIFLKTLLSSVDLFSLWLLVLMAVGGAIVARVKISSGITMVFVTWLLFVLLKAGVTAATS
jgi:hypothetical protein